MTGKGDRGGLPQSGRLPWDVCRTVRPFGLFDNQVRLYSLDELTETVRLLECSQPGRAAAELSNAVFAELAMERSRRAVELAAEAIRLARWREPREDIGSSGWQAGTAEVRAWALRRLRDSRGRRNLRTGDGLR